MMIEYAPKGEMCLSCVKLLDKCNHLPFKDMYVIERDKDGTKYVRCNGFKRSGK